VGHGDESRTIVRWVRLVLFVQHVSVSGFVLFIDTNIWYAWLHKVYLSP
jgi:hypothetical protein